MNLSDLTIDQIVRKDCLDKYEEGRHHIYNQIHLLNRYIFIADKFVRFPSDVFLGPEDMIFWSRVVHNSLENAVLKIIKLSEDDGSDKLTIHTFKNKILILFINDIYRNSFQQELREAKFDAQTEGLLMKAYKLRNTRIAHSLIGERFELSTQDIFDFSRTANDD